MNMDITTVIREEIKSLFENLEIYTIPELIQMLRRKGEPEANLPILQDILWDEYKKGGDDAVVKAYAEMSGVEIEALRNGRYVFHNLTGGGRSQLEAVQVLQEVGEGTMTPYSYDVHNEFIGADNELMTGAGFGATYTFFTDADIDYRMDFSVTPYKGNYVWVASFEAVDYDDDEVLNTGEQYRVLSTVMKIIKDFLVKTKTNTLLFDPIGAGSGDYRRMKFYMAYINKNKGSDYDVSIEGNIIVLKKTGHEVKTNRELQVSDLSEVQDNAFHTPDEMPS